MTYSEEKISRSVTITEAYENLANAIVKQAVVDYKAQLRKLAKKPKDKDAQREAERLEKFFHSGWYEQLTNLDGDWLIRKVREMVKDEIKEKMRKKAEQLKKELEKEEKAFRKILEQILAGGARLDEETVYYLESMDIVDGIVIFGSSPSVCSSVPV